MLLKKTSFIEWELNISDIVGILVSIIAIIISIISLKQSEKSIKLANRPYVVVYREYIQVLEAVNEYIVIKNFGKSGAVINSVNFSPEYKDDSFDKIVFSNIANTFIAPNQSISTLVSMDMFSKNEEKKRHGITEVKINYQEMTDKKPMVYEEYFKINEDLRKDINLGKSSPDEKKSIQQVTSFVASELLRRKL